MEAPCVFQKQAAGGQGLPDEGRAACRDRRDCH